MIILIQSSSKGNNSFSIYIKLINYFPSSILSLYNRASKKNHTNKKKERKKIPICTVCIKTLQDAKSVCLKLAETGALRYG